MLVNIFKRYLKFLTGNIVPNVGKTPLNGRKRVIWFPNLKRIFLVLFLTFTEVLVHMHLFASGTA